MRNLNVAFTALMLANCAMWAVIVAVAAWGVPRLWELLRPWLHAAAA